MNLVRIRLARLAENAHDLDLSSLGFVDAGAIAASQRGVIDYLMGKFRDLFPHYADYESIIRLCGEGDSQQRLPLAKGFLFAIVSKANDDERDGIEMSNIVGFRVLFAMKRRRFGYGMFTGILPAFQGRGVGSWSSRESMRALEREALKSNQPTILGFVVEVEKVNEDDSGSVQLIKRRRISFHQRNGAYELPLTYYCPTSPPLENAGLRLLELHTVVMHMFFYPRQTNYRLSKSEIIELLEGFYFDIYGLPRGSEYFTRTVHSIKITV